MSDDQRILSSWQRNAGPWVQAVREQAIESRRLVTDRAIVEAVLACRPATLIDLGCGEGWLVRELARHGIAGLGLDAIPALVESARSAGGGEFRAMTYEAVATGGLQARADVVVCNFSLLGGAVVDGLLRAVPSLLQPGGQFILQTLHPLMACGDAPYQDGWREGSWAGFSDAFSDPAPWYFRTLGGWLRTLDAAGLRLVELREPLHPHTGKPASLLIRAGAAD
jgi:2-polyprenyl-3-methyl-5-hydroxy-6-metoxy-1,4-benzoquinol methylase